MKRTYKKTITPEGQRRKMQKTMCELLKQRDPQLYMELMNESYEIVMTDNNDPLTKIHTFGVGSVKKPSKTLLMALYITEQERRAEIERRLQNAQLSREGVRT